MLACPYCYNQFAEKDISFRCTGRPGPEGEECRPVRDENLVRWLGISTPLPPCFDADGRRFTARCPHCHGESPYRVCPSCHSRLPVVPAPFQESALVLHADGGRPPVERHHGLLAGPDAALHLSARHL